MDSNTSWTCGILIEHAASKSKTSPTDAQEIDVFETDTFCVKKWRFEKWKCISIKNTGGSGSPNGAGVRSVPRFNDISALLRTRWEKSNLREMFVLRDHFKWLFFYGIISEDRDNLNDSVSIVSDFVVCIFNCQERIKLWAKNERQRMHLLLQKFFSAYSTWIYWIPRTYWKDWGPNSILVLIQKTVLLQCTLIPDDFFETDTFCVKKKRFEKWKCISIKNT